MVLTYWSHTVAVTVFNYITVAIFIITAYNFLFPLNIFLPLDRRATSLCGAIFCFLVQAFAFPSRQIDVLHAVDWSVLVLLSSIMIVNFLVMGLRETKRMIARFQKILQSNHVRGFWALSFIAFIVSPFLTNDGVCLLLVEPLLNTFIKSSNNSDTNGKRGELTRSDAFYFLLALACSANIGSALTYTGNPQNMIVASSAIGIMPPYKFLAYMSIPSLITWFITTKWIERSWLQHRLRLEEAEQQLLLNDSFSQLSHAGELTLHLPNDEETGQVGGDGSSHLQSPQPKPATALAYCSCGGDDDQIVSPTPVAFASPLSPRRRLAREREQLVVKVVKVITSPLPYIILVLLFAMIVMIFVDVMSISLLICITAIVMVLTVVLGNHWRNTIIWDEATPAAPTVTTNPIISSNKVMVSKTKKEHRRTASGSSFSSKSSKVSKYSKASTSIEEREEKENEEEEKKAIEMTTTTSTSATVASEHKKAEDELGPMTREDRIDNLNEFFEAMFNSIDYSLLIIFLGLFIVVESVAETGFPRLIWTKIAGKSPFNTISSIAGISCFVLIASQLLGNVAVVQLAKPNVDELNDEAAKRMAWAIISFVSTIGGNLTITGSAANIIVAEKSNRMDPTIELDFMRHFKVCFGVTLLCCTIGASLLAVIIQLDHVILGSNW